MAVPWSSKRDFDELQSAARFALRGVRLPSCTLAEDELPLVEDGLSGADILVEDGTVAWIGAPGSRTDLPPGPDVEHCVAWPCPVDCHTHLDKGQIWPRSRNPDGTFASALVASAADGPAYQTGEDIRRRAAFQLKAAYASGTCAIRTHLDSSRDIFDTSFAVLTEQAAEWAGRIELQVCPFTGPDEPADRIGRLAERAATERSGVLSGFLYTSPGLDAFLDRFISLAERYGLMLDFHADENLDPGSHCLRAVAQAVLRNKYQGPVLAGHCCALSVQSESDVAETLDLVAEAGIGVVSLPLCNAYLMDRRVDVTPRARGVAPLHEMRARGIPVAIASDNVRDAFYAYGDLDAAELFRDALRMMQLDHPVGSWPATVTVTAADHMGLADRGRITPGNDADLVVFSARNWSEFAARPLTDRLVLRAGRPIDTTRPDYRELDDLKGLAP